MTKHELSQLRYLRREIARDRARLRSLEREEGDPEKIAELRGAVSDNLTRRQDEEARIVRYINETPDAMTRLVLYARFVQGQSWTRVAMTVGGGNTADSVRMIVKRFFDKQ